MKSSTNGSDIKLIYINIILTYWPNMNIINKSANMNATDDKVMTNNLIIIFEINNTEVHFLTVFLALTFLNLKLRATTRTLATLKKIIRRKQAIAIEAIYLAFTLNSFTLKTCFERPCPHFTIYRITQ